MIFLLQSTSIKEKLQPLVCNKSRQKNCFIHGNYLVDSNNLQARNSYIHTLSIYKLKFNNDIKDKMISILNGSNLYGLLPKILPKTSINPFFFNRIGRTQNWNSLRYDWILHVLKSKTRYLCALCAKGENFFMNNWKM